MQAYIMFPAKPLLRITSSSISSHRLTSHHHLITHPCFFVLSACACFRALKIRSLHLSPLHLYRLAVFSIKPTLPPLIIEYLKRAREWPCAPPSMRLPLSAGKLLSGMTAMVFELDPYSCACCSQVAVTWISPMREICVRLPSEL